MKNQLFILVCSLLCLNCSNSDTKSGNNSGQGSGTSKSFRTSFEGNIADDFIVSDPNFDVCQPISPDYVSPFSQTTNLSHTGNNSANLIPYGNPVTLMLNTNNCASPTNSVSSAILKTTFATEKAKTLEISFFYYSNSNPQIASVNNCDSKLSVYMQKDAKDWEFISAQCGQHKTETDGWFEARISVSIVNSKNVKLGFLYQLQNSRRADPNALFLIDDLSVDVLN